MRGGVDGRCVWPEASYDAPEPLRRSSGVRNELDNLTSIARRPSDQLHHPTRPFSHSRPALAASSAGSVKKEKRKKR
jgi:hypothetical protein